MSMLLAEALLLLTIYHFSFELPDILSALLLFSVLSLVAFTWAVIKPNLINREKLFHLETQYLHLKRNSIVINSILAEGVDYEIATIPNPVRITDHESEMVITEIINPYCSPCKKAFHKTEQLIKATNGQCPSVQIAFFTQAETADNIMTKTAMHMLALSEKSSPLKMKQSLNEWFRLMDYEKWSIKYPVEINDSHLDTLRKQGKWFIVNKIEGTPTTFINNKKLSSQIDFSDLQYIVD
jgi:thiol-disulfide isomerase/thioredoxin